MSVDITKITEAISFASVKHIGQVRKNTGVAYISHPTAVSMILFNMGCNTDTIVAGLLHDTVEDTDTTLQDIADKFGNVVAHLVDCVSEDKSLSWEMRKQHTIDMLEDCESNVLKITYADKLHNLQSLTESYSEEGDSMWDKFKRGKDKQEWYYTNLLERFEGSGSLLKDEVNLFKKLVRGLFPDSFVVEETNKIKDFVQNSIHNTVYTRPAYPNKGNASILASNLILSNWNINSIDTICEFAKTIEENITYDHEISDKGLDIIYEKLKVIKTYKDMEDMKF
jgi:hypothetical protein